MWTITITNGRDLLPVLSSWRSRERAVKASAYWLKRGYAVCIHEVAS